jgi:hypothetical protein
MIEVLGLTASLADVDVSTQERSTAALDGAHSLAVAGQHLVAEPGTVLWTMLLEYVRQLGHGVTLMTWLIVSATMSSPF